jgi:serine/threonine-protein kinase HipA
MRSANVYVNGHEAGILSEIEFGKKYRFVYFNAYAGAPISVTMPITQRVYEYDVFPPFFDGLLPEGYQLDGLLKFGKIDRNDLFSQLVAVGEDLVGNITLHDIAQ